MEVIGTSPIGRVNQSNSQMLIMGEMRTASKYITQVPQMDGMMVFATSGFRSSVAGQFAQVIFVLVVLEEKYFHDNYITANPTTDVSVSTTTPNDTDGDKDPDAGKESFYLISSS